jgi:hypothetical protein
MVTTQRTAVIDNTMISPDAASLIRWASSYVPTLRERSARCEQERHILPETIKDFIDAGVVRIAQPVEFGGLGLSIDVAAEVAMEVGRGCGASAWMAAQWPGHQFIGRARNPVLTRAMGYAAADATDLVDGLSLDCNQEIEI